MLCRVVVWQCILPQVAFPAELDVYDFCTPELQQQLRAPRDAYKNYQDMLAQQKRTAKQLKTEDGAKPGPGAAAAAAAAGDAPAAAAGSDVEMKDAEGAAAAADAGASSSGSVVGALTGAAGRAVGDVLEGQSVQQAPSCSVGGCSSGCLAHANLLEQFSGRVGQQCPLAHVGSGVVGWVHCSHVGPTADQTPACTAAAALLSRRRQVRAERRADPQGAQRGLGALRVLGEAAGRQLGAV